MMFSGIDLSWVFSDCLPSFKWILSANLKRRSSPHLSKYSFPSFSIYFFPYFSHWEKWEKMGKDTFFPWAKMGLDPPSSCTAVIGQCSSCAVVIGQR